MKGELYTKVQEGITYFRKHTKRLASFYLAPKPINMEEEADGHYHFGIEGISEEKAAEVFDRQKVTDEALKAFEPTEAEHTAQTLANASLQNDWLDSAEKSYIEMSRPRIKNIASGVSLAASVGSPVGLTQKWVKNYTKAET